jgi:hypothetical protein
MRDETMHPSPDQPAPPALRSGTYVNHPGNQNTHVTIDGLTTICGREVTADWHRGERTVNGRYADCRDCRVNLNGVKS